VVSGPSSANTYRPIQHLPVISQRYCACGQLVSELLLTEITLGDPTTEVQINRRYWRTYYLLTGTSH